MIIFNNLKKLLNSLPEEKAFYAGLSFIIFIISSIILGFIFLNERAILIPKYTNKVTFATSGTKVQFLTPVYANNYAEISIVSLIFSGLTRKDEDGNFINNLAETITPDETGTNIFVKIKDNAKFNNGDDITSDDVKFTFELIENPSVDSFNKVLYEGIKIEKIDDKSFNVILKKQYPRLLEALSIGILSKKDFEKENINNLQISEKNINTVYSGIYYLDEIVSENGYKNYILKTNFNNPATKPYIKSINFRVYDNEAQIYNDFKNKQIDLVLNPNPQILSDEFTNKQFKINSFTLPRVVSLYLNPNKKQALADKTVREALYYAINRESLTSQDLKGVAQPNYFVLPGSSFEGEIMKTKEEIQEVFDKKLKSDTLNIIVSENDKHQTAALFVKKSLEEFGLEVNIQNLEASEISNNTIKNRDFEIFLYSSEISSVYDLYAFLHSGQRQAPGINITNYLSKNLDKNLESIKDSTSTETLLNSINAIKTEFYSEYPYIPLYTPTQNIIFNKNMNISSRQKITSYSDLFINIDNWSDGYQKTYQIFYNKNLINTIYSIIR